MQENPLSKEKLKPAIDRYEIILFAVIFTILAVIMLYLRNTDSFTKYLLGFVDVALVLILMVYHRERANDWKQKQQSLTPSTLQN